ncbi:MAG: hypothetical protein WBE84_10695, partial [Xanthobacteraceae bacterium]
DIAIMIKAQVGIVPAYTKRAKLATCRQWLLKFKLRHYLMPGRTKAKRLITVAAEFPCGTAVP